MAVQFVRANNTYLSTTNIPLTGQPFTVGFWMWMNSAGTQLQAGFSLCDSSLTTNYYSVGLLATEIPQMTAADSTSSTSNTTTAFAANGGWGYILARFIGSSSRRLAVLYPSGVFETAVSTIIRAPSASNILGVGARMLSTPDSFADAKVAELFLAEGNIESTANISKENLYRLAYEGPFSDPSIASKVRFYASFKDSVTSAFIANQHSNGLLAPKVLETSAIAPTLCDHPYLSATYERPRERYTSILTI